MVKPDEEEEEIQLPWGTWEELLLASAVHRHGINCWDSVAYEIRKRTSVPGLGHLLTPLNCEQRYLDLRRRYTPTDDDNRADTESEIPCLEELRKLRVAELRKEVERYDVSIASLQLKVKKLKEEHDQSLMKVDDGDDQQKSDLEKTKEMKGDRSPDENPSVGGSNSTDQRIIKRENSKGVDKIEDYSCNGSSDSVEKEPVIESTKIETESVAESKDGDGGGTGEESTDESLAGDEPEKEDHQSPAVTAGISTKSKRLIDFLEIIRSGKLFSMFERRLKSQETVHYRSLIKQHMDLETIRSRLDEGWYSTNSKFFRDLLLIIANAIVFFGKKSTEYSVSIELLSLVLKEMSTQGLSSEEHEQKDKPKSPSPIIVCRKRSSITGNPPTSLKGKPIINHKHGKPTSKIEEEQAKKRVKDSFTSSNTSSKKTDKIGNNKSSQQQRQGKGSSSLVKQPNPKNERINTNMNSKKQNPTISVNRNKRNSSTDDGLLLDKLKNLSSISDNIKSGGADQKRNGKGNGTKGQASKTSSTNWGQQVKEKECLGKQQKPVAPPAKLSNLSGKRSREGGDTTQAAASKQSKKRPRK